MFFKHEDDTLKYLDADKLKAKQQERNNVKEKIIYRDTGKFSTKYHKEDQNNFISYLAYGIAFSFAMYILTHIPTWTRSNNPILGTWRTDTGMGVIEMEFNRNSVSAFGATGNVKYEINGNKVLVIDEGLKIGTTYIMRDKNTMYTEVFGIRSVYKKVK